MFIPLQILTGIHFHTRGSATTLQKTGFHLTKENPEVAPYTGEAIQ